MLLVFGLEPIVVAGPTSFADEMLAPRRRRPTSYARAAAYPTLGIERVLALDPDVVLNAAMAEAPGDERISARTRRAGRSVRAVKSGRVVALADEACSAPGRASATGSRCSRARCIPTHVPSVTATESR